MENIRRFKSVKKLTIENDVLERDMWVNKGILCGIDEVGRGCLAGPVIASAVVLKPGSTSPLLKDSKEMLESERVLAYNWVLEHGFVGIGVIDHRAIDRYNIYRATQFAMKRALSQLMAQLNQPISQIVVDAMPLVFSGQIYKDIPITSFPFAESRSISVAAASIVAKVTRDRLMATVEQSMPGYGLSGHKGYGTSEHNAAIVAHGASIIHRETFLKKLYDSRVMYRYGKQKELFG